MFRENKKAVFYFSKLKIIELWELLLVLLRQRRTRLEQCMHLQRVFQEMINIIDWMDEIKVRHHSTLYLLTSNKGLSCQKIVVRITFEKR